MKRCPGLDLWKFLIKDYPIIHPIEIEVETKYKVRMSKIEKSKNIEKMVQIWILGNVTVNLIKLIQLFRLSPVAKSIEN